ncbi:MAG: cytochrome b/b6 domain-containing protein [Magnetococcus sp. DMHC-6]
MLYDRFTRLLHLFIATGIFGQMGVSLIMIHPKPGRPGDIFFEMHETLGLILLGVLVVNWVWVLIRQGKVAPGLLFPWFTWSRYGDILRDIQRYWSHIRQFTLPDTNQPSPLASSIQGVGLSAATLLGATGTILFFGITDHGTMPGWVHDVKELHEIFGSLLWLYLIVHASMGILHQLSGHGSMRIMLRVWEKADEQNAQIEKVTSGNR